MKPLTVVAYYTTGTAYEGEADLLCASLDRVGMTYEVVGVESRGDWYANTAFKAAFLQDARSRLAGPLLYVDVDAFVHTNCEAYFLALAGKGIDYGAHYSTTLPPKGYCPDRACAKHPWMLSGTLFLGDTPGCRRLLDLWVDKNALVAKHGIKEGGGQKRLWMAVTEMDKRLKVEKLPGRYCYVFDKRQFYGDEPCIVEHTIASREHRDQERVNKGRRDRKAELWRIVKQEAA